MREKNNFRAVILGITIIIINQFAQYFLSSRNLILAKNQNLIFGLGPQMGWFFDVSILIILFLALFIVSKTVFIYPLMIILAGAINNIIDRIFRGGVLDYFYLKVYSQNIYFNVSDVLIVIGVIIYMVLIIIEKKTGKFSHEFKIFRHK